ncbi:MAG: hypothetical protein IKR81_02665, partial [Victivallales bacterium]|nr:hypothetical protein [Victivallales bacterium]
VWIWRRRSGRTAWTNTMHSVVRMMQAHPQLTFSCSTAALYRWVEDTEPALFREIAKLVEAGRWEIVGGWEVQADAIISSPEALIRQALSAKEYFRQKFGIDVRTGYSVDSFGHSAGLPKILKATGFDNYVFLRPMSHQQTLPLLFSWLADDGSVVRALRIFDTYNIENVSRQFYMDRIDQHVRDGLPQQTLFFGVGDHGGGLYEKHLQWLEEAAEKYDIVFSTLENYFAALPGEELPTYQGELGKVHRGCYAACHEVKREIALAMDRLESAEKLGVSSTELDDAWKEILFHHFHDILPGTSIMEAYRNDIFPGIGHVIHLADRLVDRELCRRSASLDTRFMAEGGIYVRSLEPVAKTAVVSVTGFLDPNETGSIFKSLRDREGRSISLQALPPPTTFGPCAVPWADLTAVVSLPPNGEALLAYSPEACNEPNLGFDKQLAFLEKLSFMMFDDDYGTWGFELEKYLHPCCCAERVAVEKVADGPVASVLRATYRLRSSTIKVEVCRFAGIDELKLKLSIEWWEKNACLKMAYAHGLSDYAFVTGVPGASLERHRGTEGQGNHFMEYGTWNGHSLHSEEVSMNEWCAVFSNTGNAAFFTSDLHSCDYAEGRLRLTLLRSCLYSDHHPFPRNEQTGNMELGMTFMELWFSDTPTLNACTISSICHNRLRNVEVLEVTAHQPGPEYNLPKCPIALDKDNVQLLAAYKDANDQWNVHLLNHGPECTLEFCGKSVTLPAKGVLLVGATRL